MLQDHRQLAVRFRVGAFVLVALAAFLTLIYLLGARSRLFEARDTVYADFTEVGGLIEGATVRLAGVQIGRVTAVRLPGQPGGKVRVEMKIGRQFADRVRRDSIARIDTQGLLGDKIVEITAGSASEPALPPGGVLLARAPADVGQVISDSSQVVKNVTVITDNLKKTTETLNQSKMLEDVAATAAATRRLAEQLDKGSGAKALADLAESAATARRLAERIESGSGWAHALVYDEPAALAKLDKILAATQAILDRAGRGEGAVGVLASPESTEAARKLVRAMDRIGQAAAEPPGPEQGLVGALLFDPSYKAVVDDLRTVARNLRDVSDRLTGGRGALGGLLADEPAGDLRQAAADLKVAMANLKEITEKLNAGEGTLGALIADPTVYENLSAVLDGARRSFLLRSLIRGLGQKGRGAAAESERN